MNFQSFHSIKSPFYDFEILAVARAFKVLLFTFKFYHLTFTDVAVSARKSTKPLWNKLSQSKAQFRLADNEKWPIHSPARKLIFEEYVSIEG